MREFVAAKDGRKKPTGNSIFRHSQSLNIFFRLGHPSTQATSSILGILQGLNHFFHLMQPQTHASSSDLTVNRYYFSLDFT